MTAILPFWLRQKWWKHAVILNEEIKTEMQIRNKEIICKLGTSLSITGPNSDTCHNNYMLTAHLWHEWIWYRIISFIYEDEEKFFQNIKKLFLQDDCKIITTSTKTSITFYRHAFVYGLLCSSIFYSYDFISVFA